MSIRVAFKRGNEIMHGYVTALYRHKHYPHDAILKVRNNGRTFHVHPNEAYATEEECMRAQAGYHIAGFLR